MYPLAYMVGLDNFTEGAWFEPSNDTKIEYILSLLDIHPGERIVDLGSGDGKIVIEMARRGASAVGIERDAKLVQLARKNIQAAQLKSKATIIHASFWDISLVTYDKVYMYQFKTVMERFEKKLLTELPSQALVVSNHWQFPTWKPEKNVEDVFLYRKP